MLFHQNPRAPLAAAAAVAQTLLHERASEGRPVQPPRRFQRMAGCSAVLNLSFAGEHVKASPTYERAAA